MKLNNPKGVHPFGSKGKTYCMNTENELRIVKRLTGVDDNRIEVSETGWTSRVYIIDGGKIVNINKSWRGKYGKQ